jgi:ATP-dependent Lhr-like helicase
VSGFNDLSPEIREYIWDKKWPNLCPIQEASITHFSTTSNNLILAAPTASGKTEAAFLPAMSSIQDWDVGLKILYISPLIALINDQFQRIQELSNYMDIPVTRWHGEALQSAKKNLIKNPKGILLITPESIEAMLVRKPEQAHHLFDSVEVIIIDEIHSFLDTTRGVHLQSLLSRLFTKSDNVRYFGLSATISVDSYALTKNYFPSNKDTSIIIDRATNIRDISIHYFEKDSRNTDIDPRVLDAIYQESCASRMLVFPNSRRAVEEITVGLERRSNHAKGRARYFAHHSSVDKDLRVEAEQFAKLNDNDLFTISCTSTLELGIDIGSVDRVVQVEAAHSVASLSQRLGRSGRRNNGMATLSQYASRPWSLLQSLSLISLLEEGHLDPIIQPKKQYSMLFQQVLSLLMETKGIVQDDLYLVLSTLKFTDDIPQDKVIELVEWMIQKDYIEVSGEELIVGLSAEYIVTNRSFYAHFEDTSDLLVIYEGQKVGEIPLNPTISVNANIFLAGKIWKIIDIDEATRKIFVQRARDGRPPDFGGQGGNVSSLVRERMLAILADYFELPISVKENNDAVVSICNLKQETKTDSGQPAQNRSIVGDKTFFTFSSSQINSTLHRILLDRFGGIEMDDSDSSLTSTGMLDKVRSLQDNLPTTEELIEAVNKQDSIIASSSKYAKYLPTSMAIDQFVTNYFDIEGARSFLSNMVIKLN